MWEFLYSSLEIPYMLKKKEINECFQAERKKAKFSGKNEESIKGKYKRTYKLDLLKPSKQTVDCLK